MLKVDNFWNKMQLLEQNATFGTEKYDIIRM